MLITLLALGVKDGLKRSLAKPAAASRSLQDRAP